MKKALITGITGQDGSYLAGSCWKRATMSTASSAVLLSITRRIAHLEGHPTSTSITATSAIR